jgi:hypothetical protein
MFLRPHCSSLDPGFFDISLDLIFSWCLFMITTNLCCDNTKEKNIVFFRGVELSHDGAIKEDGMI